VTSAPGILTAQPTPDVARRSWPRYLALGLGMIAVGVAGVLLGDLGARVLLGGVGLFVAVRGAVLLRAARTGSLDDEVLPRAGLLGGVALGAGALALAAALASATLAAQVLMVGVPLALLVAAVSLLARGGTVRRGGLALLVWTVLVTGVLVVTGLAQDWDRAADVARVVTALVVAVLGVPMLVAAANYKQIADRPAPARAGGCGGCACGAGGCGSA
jgi:hypothetical protein